MEKKNIVFVGRSLDGYIAGKNGELDWLDSVPGSQDIDMGYTALMDEIDALVMGRNTFDVVIGFGGEWPYKKHVFVLSNTLTSVQENLHGKVTLLQGAPQEVLRRIHDTGCFKLYIDGGKTIQEFLSHDLIDEMIITTIPVLIGGGFPLFGALDGRLEFDHVKSRVFAGQIVQDHYRRKRDFTVQAKGN